MNGYWKEFRTSCAKVHLYRGYVALQNWGEFLPQKVPSRQEVLTCPSHKHFHKEGTDTRFDFQSVFGTSLCLSAGRIHGFHQESTQDVQIWVHFSLLLEERDIKLADLIGSYIKIVPHQN